MREKLIELLTDVIPHCDNELRYVDDERVERLADHLIANGVTVTDNNVGKWIPVTERLPDLELVEAQANDEELYPCLVTMKHRPSKGGKIVSKMWYDGEGFVDRDYRYWTPLVTHWMPLPEPPKGE